jgi:hypothetical protein
MKQSAIPSQEIAGLPGLAPLLSSGVGAANFNNAGG